MNRAFNRVNQKWLVLLAIGASTFMSALDTSVVNTVLPVINQSLGSDIAQVEWVVTVYLLIVSGLLLTFGRLGDLLGHKRVFLWGFGIFITASALCGLSPTVGYLITFRGIQAFGAAMLASNSPAILTKNFPATQRGQALGLQATMTYLGLTVAPSLGGWLTDLISWRAIFYINVPVGSLALILSWTLIPPVDEHKREERFDIAGAGLFLAGLITLMTALNQGHAWGWGSVWIIGLFGFSLLTLTVFIRVENKKIYPMLDLRLFKDRIFTSSALSAVANYIAIFSILLLFPFYLINGRGLSPAQAGALLTIQPMIMAIIAPISGTLSDRIGTKIPCALGMAIMTVGLLGMTRLSLESSFIEAGLSLGIAGLGTGMFISPNNSALMGAAPRNRQGIAAGILATARSVGMVLGVGMAGAILTTVLAHDSSPASLTQAAHLSFFVAAGFTTAGALLSFVKE
jgi:EmrB/QacA subfamily drug resistance transporter